MAVQVNVTIDFSEAARQLAAFQQELGQELVQSANQSQQAFQRVASEAAQNVQRQTAQITQGVQDATTSATRSAARAGKNMTEEFLRAFDPDKIRAELEAAGLDEQQIDILINTTQARAETQKLKDAIAGAFGEASGLAEESLKQITAQAAREVDRAAGKVKSVTEIVDGVRDLTEEVKRLDGAGGEAAESLGMLVLNETVDKFGDLKDIFEKSAGALFGLSEEAVDATVRVADLAEKGAMVGAAFGPMGAAIGLVAGGALGALVESLTASSKQAEEAAAAAAEYEQRVARLSIAASVAVSQEELNAALEEGRKAAEANAGAVKILTDAQAAEQKRVEEVQAKIASYKAELESLNKTRTEELSLLQEEEIRSRKNILTYEISTYQVGLLDEAKGKLTTATKALTIAEQEQQKVASILAQTQAIQAIDTLDAANAIEEQLLIITQGSKFAKQSTSSLEAEQARLIKTLGVSAKEIEGLGLANIELADSQFDAVEATQAQNENQEQANIITAYAKADLARLAEITSELSSRKQALASSTKASTAATKEDTAAKKEAEQAAKALEKAEEVYAKIQEDRAEKKLAYQRRLRDQAQADYLAEQAALKKRAEEELKLAQEIAKKRDEAEQYARKLQNERKQKEAEDALAQAEQLLRPLEDVTTTIFDTIVENVANGEKAFAGLGIAIRDSIVNTLKAMGKEYLVKALGETAEGIASLAIGGPIAGASAAAHFKAAAGFAAAAVAAGAGAAAIGSVGGAGGGGGIPTSGAGGGGANAGGGGSASLGGASSSASSQGPAPTVVVDFRGAMFPTTDLRAAQEFGAAVAGYIDAAFRSGATTQRPIFRR
jgi:hypothetical protein